MSYKLHSTKVRVTRAHDLRKQYGLTHYVFDDILRWQNYKCPICLRSFDNDKLTPCVDHNHVSEEKEVRGCLCKTCNQGIGMFSDNIQILQNAIEYLERQCTTN